MSGTAVPPERQLISTSWVVTDVHDGHVDLVGQGRPPMTFDQCVDDYTQ